MSTAAISQQYTANPDGNLRRGDIALREEIHKTHAMGVTKNHGRPLSCTAENGVIEDRLLVAEAKSGDTNAFGALYKRHRSKIHRMAFRILRNQQDAEDAVQRTFQRVFTNLMRFREDSSLSTWMTRIAINEALMLLRQRRPNTALEERDNDDAGAHSSIDVQDEGPTPEQALAQTELRNAVSQAILKLGHNLRVVVVLREVHGLSIAEIARRLGLSVAAVKGRIFHARRHLRRHLAHKFPAGFMIGARE